MRNCHVRLLLSGLVTLLMLVLVSSFANAQQPPLVDVTGSWLIHSTDWDGKKAEKHIQLKQNGNQITGYFKGPNQSGGLSGFVNGRHISFTTKTRNQLHFRGMVQGDTIEGNWGIHGRVGEWTASRINLAP